MNSDAEVPGYFESPDSSEPSRRARLLKGLAFDAGFDLVGIAPATPSAHTEFLHRWIAAGRHGDMEYLADSDALRRRSNPALTLPDVQSILVVAHNYHQEDPEGIPDDASRGIIARYARGRDYQRVMKGRLDQVYARLREILGEEISGRSYVDTGPILERELAALAGLGWFGQNTMLIHPRRGSFFFLGTLLLSIEIEPDPPFVEDRCGSCRACLDACPTGALLGRDADGAPVMDATRCISYLTIENRGPIPEKLRPRIGNRIYGCDICQEACPFNERFSAPSAEPGYAPRAPGARPTGVEALPQDDADVPRHRNGMPADDLHASAGSLHPGTDAPRLIDLLEMALSEERWESFSRGSAIRRAGREGFARNVCVALGNWGAPEARSILSAALSDPSPLVREHAEWALKRVVAPSQSLG
jgi:epoxyqueuosine reductase